MLSRLTRRGLHKLVQSFAPTTSLWRTSVIRCTFATITGDRDSGGSDRTSTNSTKHLLVNLCEPTVPGNDIGRNTGTQPGNNPAEQSLESSNKAKAVLLANAVQAAQRIPYAIDGLSSVLTSDRMTFANVTGEREKLEVCNFPREMGMFPSFFDSYKQCEAVGSDLIFRRIRPIDEVRFAKTITALKKGRKVVWYGHPGIGKSTEANFVLLEFLRHLGDGEDSEWPTKVAHRVEGQLYLYKWNATTRRVECGMLPGKTLDDVEEFSSYWRHQSVITKKKPPVLFLELKEDENDPLVSIPTFIALPSRDVIDVVLKTMFKSGRGEYLLVRPHEPEEVLLMAKLIFEVDPEQLCALLDCEKEWDKVAKVVSDSMDIVGPLVRQVVYEQSVFESYTEVMIGKAKDVVKSTELARLSVFSIPPSLQFFVAPFPLERDTAGPIKHEFKFLSRHAALLLALSATPEFLIHAAEHRLDYQLTEAFLSALLLRDSSVAEEWRTSWEWHADPAYETYISERTKMAISDTPLINRRGRHITFPGTYYEGDAQELEGDALYLSQTINFRLGAMFMAVKENGRTVAINMFQTTTKALPDHPFPLAAVNMTMTRFGLFEQHNANVTLNLICLVDNSLEKVSGWKFKVDDTVNGKVEVKDMTVDELRQAHPEVGNRLKTFVVRTGLYHLDRAKIISLPL